MANNNIIQPILESWVDFDLGEDVRDADRLLQDEKWQNATADGRVHLSHRENTFKHSLEFKQAIRNYYVITEDLFKSLSQKTCLFSKLDDNMLRLIVDYAFPGGQGLLVEREAERLMTNKRLLTYLNEYSLENKVPFKICVRRRPLNQFEINSGAYNCVHAKSKESTIILHDGRLARNDRSLSMKHSHYILDRVWDEHSTNKRVCMDEIEPLVKHIENGNNASLILFGQTGTGKTYTLVGTLEYLSNRLVGKTVSIIFYEIHGKKCYDLLSNRKVVKLLSDENEDVHVRGAKKVTLLINKYEDILNILKEALLLRSCEITERNPISSRSHAVCTIQLITNLNINNNEEISFSSCSSSSNSNIENKLILGGKITLVDLAGSERNYETTKMTAAMHRESAEINFALMALKDCFRCYHALATGQKTIQRTQSRCVDSVHDKDIVRPPFRASLLTRVLRECFIINKDKAPHLTVLLATVSPTPTDLLHSTNTLDHIVLCGPHLSELVSWVTIEVPIIGAALTYSLVEEWTTDQLNYWLATAEGGRFSQLVLPLGLDGKGLMNLNLLSLSALFQGELRASREGEEGNAWVIDGSCKESYLGRALWRSLKREQNSAKLRKIAMKEEYSSAYN